MKRSALITGATGNLGKAVLERFQRDDYNISVVVSPGKKSSSGFEPSVNVLEADLTNEKNAEKAVDDAFSKFGSIDVALLLVGGFAAGKINEADGASVKKMFALNFETAYHIARPVFARMKTQPAGGKIILVGARPALNAKDGKNVLAYALSKSLLFKLAELLNAEGSSSNVITSVIVPSTIDTPANREAMPDKNFSDWVKPEEIASSIAFLCSEDNKSLREPIMKLYGNA